MENRIRTDRWPAEQHPNSSFIPPEACLRVKIMAVFARESQKQGSQYILQCEPKSCLKGLEPCIASVLLTQVYRLEESGGHIGVWRRTQWCSRKVVQNHNPLIEKNTPGQFEMALTGSKLDLVKPEQNARSCPMRLPMQGSETVQETQVIEHPPCFVDRAANSQISRGCSSLFGFVSCGPSQQQQQHHVERG